MSKKSRFFLTVIIVGLAFIAGVRLYRMYENHVAQTATEEEPSVMTFNNVPVNFRPAVEEVPVFQPLPDPDEPKEVFLEEPVLAPEQAQEQAKQTIVSVLNDYQQDPQIQAFYKDLREATGENVTLEQLSGTQLPQLLKQHPQLQQVMAKHAKDPQFAKTLQEIFSNPQFVQSVAVLQGGQTTKKM